MITYIFANRNYDIMKIHISSTPEVPENFVHNVCNILNEAQGDELVFSSYNSLSTPDIRKMNYRITQTDKSVVLSFDDLFSICNGFRLKYSIADDDFVVILTSARNNLNWFSATKDKNIFIDINDWDEYTDRDAKYGVSYQVIENVFQSLIGISCDNAENHPNVHYENEGCINEMCLQKSKVIVKLKTADICSSCYNTALEEGISIHVMTQIFNIIKNIREEVITRVTDNMIEPKILRVESKGKIRIGGKYIKLEPLPRALYIFFLKHPEGESQRNLCNHVDEIFDLYKKIKAAAIRSRVENLTRNYIDKRSTFNKNHSKLNADLIEQIPESIANFYTVNKDNNDLYKVRVSPDYLDIRPEF